MSRVPCTRSVRASARDECSVMVSTVYSLGRRESIPGSSRSGEAAQADTILARRFRLHTQMKDDVFRRERARLLAFIRRRVPDARDAEDVLQDVFSRLVEANRLLMPIDHVTGWLFRVARNRITDLFREKRARVGG